MCSNVLGWHCPWQVPLSLLRSGVLMFTLHALWRSVCVRRLCGFNCFTAFISIRSFQLRSLNGFANTFHASLDSLWSWWFAMVGSVCVDRAPVASFVFCFRQNVSERRIARLAPRDCVGICFGCSMFWLVRWVCVLVDVS